MVDPDEIALGLILLVLAGIWYAITHYWMWLLGGGVLTWLGFLAYEWCDDHPEYFRVDPPIPPTTWIIVRGSLDNGRYVLVRTRVASPYRDYPALLTLSYFDQHGVPSATYTKVLNSELEECAVRVGTRGGLPIICVSTSKACSAIDMNRPQNPAGWQQQRSPALT